MKKSKCLVSKCFLGLSSTGTQRGLLTNRLCQLPPCLPHLVHSRLGLSVGTAPFPQQVLRLNSFRQLGGQSKVLLSLRRLKINQPDRIHMPKRHILFKKKKIFFNVYFWDRERQHEQGRVRERGRQRIWNRLQALSGQHRAWRAARTHGPRDHDLSRSRMLNRLNHPGVPIIIGSEIWCYPAHKLIN